MQLTKLQAVEKFPMLKQFKDNWAICDFVKLELKRTVQQSWRSHKKLSKVCIFHIVYTRILIFKTAGQWPQWVSGNLPCEYPMSGPFTRVFTVFSGSISNLTLALSLFQIWHQIIYMSLRALPSPTCSHGSPMDSDGFRWTPMGLFFGMGLSIVCLSYQTFFPWVLSKTHQTPLESNGVWCV